MKARMPAGFGRPDMNALMRQAQKMQEDMKAKQAELEAAEYTGSAAGEMVTVKMNGKHEVLSITIKPEAVDPDDVEMLEDMVAAAINATVKQVDETATAVPIGPYEPKSAGKTVSNAEQSLHALEKLGLDVSIEDSARKTRS